MGVAGDDVIFAKNKHRHRVGRTLEHIRANFQRDPGISNIVAPQTEIAVIDDRITI